MPAHLTNWKNGGKVLCQETPHVTSAEDYVGFETFLMWVIKEKILGDQLSKREVFIIRKGQAFAGAKFSHLQQGNRYIKSWSFQIVKASLLLNWSPENVSLKLRAVSPFPWL